MTKQTIQLELDDETVRCLRLLGSPVEVLGRLAQAAADGVHYPDRPRRAQTDTRLQHERDKTDSAFAQERDKVEAVADEVLRVARERAAGVVRTARDHASGAIAQPSATDRAHAAGVLEEERAKAAAVLATEREAGRHTGRFLAAERESTNVGLSGERAHVDSLIGDQREANSQMVAAALRAQELAVEADAAKERAEESESQLREVAEFREMFIGILGHDLRTPLGSVVMAAGVLLQRGHLDESDALIVARIIRNAQRMTRMITQLLDLTRARLGGGFPIEPQPTDLREVCQHVIEEFDAPIKLDIEGDVTGTWDEDRLAEVLVNLTGNAIEYRTRGTDVIMRARVVGPEVVVEIINQGDPIPDDVLPFIFEPFRRARQFEKSPTGNLGLGLYIAHQIVLSHGGTLEARSAAGATTFTIRIPRQRNTDAQPDRV